jgi:hypothetical protein
MSTGAVFLLVTNDGRQDKILTATQFLHKRLLMISKARAEQNINPIPTLADIERTHILFVNAHFKPFVAIAYEYTKTQVQGSISLGQKAQFNIPQFGDFFSDMVLRTRLTMSPTTFKSHTVDDTTYGTWDDVEADDWRWRWCTYPGERIIQLAEFTVNGNPLDSYTPYAANIWREYMVQPNNKRGWDRCMGQQLDLKGALIPVTYISNLSTFTSYSNLYYAMHNCQLHVDVTSGLQTPAYSHDRIVELWIPLLFWFNTDFRLSIPSVAIPYGARYINITLANANKLVGYASDFSATLTDLNESHEILSTYPSGSSVTWSNDKFTVDLELYINNLFVNPEIHEIFIRRIAFNLIRVHRMQENNINTNTDKIWLNQLKWPIETLYIGMQSIDVDTNTASNQYDNLEQWNTFTKNAYEQCILPLSISNMSQIPVATTSTLSQLVYATFPLPLMRTIAMRRDPILTQITITAHGIKLYDAIPANFFSMYVPYRFGGPNVNTPNDPGLCMVNFCLYPGSYQPSGHVNVSRAREFYFEYTVSSDASDDIVDNTYHLKILASAINFLLISDGSAVLRYTT